jgi:outer membrane protein OmpA-like peptidoglycan-associated protein
LLDSSKVEIWRKEAGMESLSDYAAKWGIYFQNGKNEKFQRHENIIYFEDFSAYALGKMPSRWVFKDKHISDRGGLAALEPKSAFQILQSSRALVCLKGNVCFFRPVEDNVLHGYRTNLTLECDFLMAVSDATYGGSFGILLGKNNDYRKDYLLLSFNQDHLEIICQGNRYFSRTIAILSIMDSTWHTVGLSYEWDDVKVFLDDNYLITVPSCVYPDFFQLEGADLFAIRKVIVTHDDPALRPFKIAVPEPMNINFEVDQSFIKPYDTLFMLHVVDWLKIHSDYTIKVMGYADHDGDSVYNVKLSLRRAEAVKNELLRFGLQSNRIALKAFGFNKPLDRSNTNEGKALNRRVEFVVDKLPKNMESPVSSHDTGTP